MPQRTETNRRLYSDEDIRRLCLLKQATDLGCRIAQIAHMTLEQLEKLVADSQPSPLSASFGAHTSLRSSDSQPSSAHLVEHLLNCIESLQMDEMERTLREAMVRYGHQGILCQVIAPLSQAMGEAWEQGRLTIAHEHAATAFLKTFLMSTSRSFLVSETAPRLVVGTPPGQLHELGAVLVASLAANYGWKAVYCGASVPPAELVGAVKQSKARVLALSLVFPGGDADAIEALRTIRHYLPAPFPIMVGGRAVNTYTTILDDLSITSDLGLVDIQQTLDKVKNAHMLMK